MIKSILLLFSCLVIATLASANQSCIKVELWGNTSTFGQDPELQEHPCGGIKTVCVEKIEEIDGLHPSWAYELPGDKTKIINKWPIPADGQVYDLSGESLIVAYPNYKKEPGGNAWEPPRFLRVDHGGNIEGSKPTKEQFVEYFECPRLNENRDIEQMWCYSFTANESKVERIIAVPPVCD